MRCVRVLFRKRVFKAYPPRTRIYSIRVYATTFREECLNGAGFFDRDGTRGGREGGEGVIHEGGPRSAPSRGGDGDIRHGAHDIL